MFSFFPSDIWKKIFFPITVCGLLTGCSLTDILTGVQTDYSITRNEKDAPASDYLQTILEERIKEKTKALSKVDETRLRQEEYLEQTVRADLLKALYAKGYYGAKIDFKKGDTPLSGTYEIDYGPQFTIQMVDVTPRDYSALLKRDMIEPGMTLDAENVLEAQSELYKAIQKDRCYFSLDVKNEVYLDKAHNHGEVNFIVDAGQEGVLGPIAFKGNKSVKESYLRKLVPWKEGDCFRREKLESYKTTLLQSGLFARAETILPDAPAADGTVPVTVELRERAHRSITAGLTYYSDEGPGAVFGWEHRNIFGAAEKLKAGLTLSTLKQSLDSDFTKPYFLRMDQDLFLNTSLHRQDTDAFEEIGVDAGIKLNRKFNKRLSGSTGLDFTVTRIDDHTDKSTKTYGLVSAPQSVLYDSRDDKLDPHKGWNLNATAEPFFDAMGESNPFFKMQLMGSGYFSFGTSADIVLASRAGIGSLWGTDLEDIPATERFYAGGGGSVRGYGHQEVGPQKNGDPTGGRSLVNGSLELRGKFTSSIGGVLFVDAAKVSEETTPEFSDLAIGAGVGLRYYTSFGPIRFDIATPLTQKDNLDQNYQFYISIGQAF